MQSYNKVIKIDYTNNVNPPTYNNQNKKLILPINGIRAVKKSKEEQNKESSQLKELTPVNVLENIKLVTTNEDEFLKKIKIEKFSDNEHNHTVHVPEDVHLDPMSYSNPVRDFKSKSINSTRLEQPIGTIQEDITMTQVDNNILISDGQSVHDEKKQVTSHADFNQENVSRTPMDFSSSSNGYKVGQGVEIIKIGESHTLNDLTDVPMTPIKDSTDVNVIINSSNKRKLEDDDLMVSYIQEDVTMTPLDLTCSIKDAEVLHYDINTTNLISHNISNPNDLIPSNLQDTNGTNNEVNNEIINLKKTLQTTHTTKERIELYNKLGKFSFIKGNYNESIAYLNESLCIKFKDNIDALWLRNDCFKALGNNEEYLRGIILAENLGLKTVDKEEKFRLLSTVITNKTNSFIAKHGLEASKVNFKHFFVTFIGIMPKEENELSQFIINEDYYSLNAALVDPECENKYYRCNEGLFTVKAMRAGLYYLKELKHDALACLEGCTTQFEFLLQEFINYDVKKLPFNLSNINEKEIEESNNPTLIYYLAKLFYLRGNLDEYFRLLNLINNYEFVFHEIMRYYKTSKQTEHFLNVAKEAIRKFGSNSYLLILMANYALDLKNFDELDVLLKHMKDTDPRTLIIKGRYALFKKDRKSSINYFEKALSIDPTLFSAYFNKAEILSLSNPKESYDVYLQSLAYACCYKQAYLAYSRIFRIECKLEFLSHVEEDI